MNKTEQNIQTDFYNKVVDLLNEARKSVVQTVNIKMVYTYFEIGRIILEEEQNGKERAKYGKQILKELSNKLSSEFGKGFSVTNLQQMKSFYIIYGKQQTLSVKSENQQEKSDLKLSWSHYLFLMRIDNIEERKFYEIEAINNDWSLRELRRQYDTSLYKRLALRRDKKGIKELSEKGQIIEKGKKTEVKDKNETYHFRQFSPKPDSTNSFIK
ncbi:MAG: DUF1016 N-terminal domain-containing protein [Bacteroidales bacterium]|nr:DUF1016 N-terminal domain-containing protein [Bacteroidales bacterium]MDY0215900.1 DUF1016 N-terminal domain-containing protein [Bacteroidales bacterium]